ncbi:MAG: glycosyltransferase [Pyrinomonadaceae bacterium]
MNWHPLISCIMPTADRRAFVARAVEYFLRQDYAEKELIVVDDGADAVADLIPADARVRYFRLDKRLTVGAKRNFACERARGELVAHWDDDDWHAPRRLSYQVEELRRAGAEVCGIRELLFYDVRDGRAWRYVYPAARKAWLSGSSLCYRRAFWERNRFREINVGEDARFVWESRGARLHALADPTFHVGIIHAANVSPKRTAGSYWTPHDAARVRALLGDDCAFYDHNFACGAARDAGSSRACETLKRVPRDEASQPASRTSSSPSRPRRALVAAAYGVGDVLRVSPLVRAFSRLGYETDVLVAPDFAETASLLEGAPEVRRVFRYENFRADRGARGVAGLAGESYDCAAFSLWAAPLRRHVRARRVFEFAQREWLREGDTRCVEKIARAVGWANDLPAPFAVASERRFNLAPGTVALHAGCKPDWQWKKWHGFDGLARLFESVVVVGTESDLRNDATYFRRAFEWAPHVQDFVGKLSLRDTAALIKSCAALVSNDSGVMHLGVAVGVPTFGVFGITSPRREAMRSPLMHVVTKGLDCERACREKPWGRRDCERRLECLKALTSEEVFERVARCVPAVRGSEAIRIGSAEREAVAAACETKVVAPRGDGVACVEEVARGEGACAPNTAASPASSLRRDEAACGGGKMDEVSLTYYGYVFDASGYGHAARAYIHALGAAGVNLSVVDLAAHRQRQVRDPLVESLVGRKVEADFHLFHGIPPQWAARAFRMKNALGMTVWETDVMPSQWRNALNHVLEVWLPCEFNVSVFRRSLERPVFKLPHPLLPSRANGVEPNEFLRVAEGDFVFYSIFEWQDRKSPQGTIQTYLREFRDARDAVLVVKTNPGAAAVAERALAQAREAAQSRARVEVRAEAWSDAQVRALHRRGDCYLSLHRGEGWCYPLFEAAAGATPVVATNFSGPLEYLCAEEHALVSFRLERVRQPYVYYHPSMRWAEPDLAHAAQLMREVYERRGEWRERAARGAARLREEFSLEAVGRTARAKLCELLARTKPAKSRRVESHDRARGLAPEAPVPGAWYDADYFERGVKSNWAGGYSWRGFEGLFRQTAAFLTETFAEADSFLDAGCAKGFLVRALRGAGRDARGFDHSAWAIERADAATKPFLTLAGTDDFDFARGCDVLTAFSLLESLTEDQIASFLSRARGHTRQALLAVVTSFESEAEIESYRRKSRDLSQITLRPRAWWGEQFAAAGWRQGALGRIAERACQQHQLPKRMGWKVYVYSPE